MSLIGRFEHLPNRPRSDEARPLLEKIASQVKPIMAKREWKVGTLAEFLPSNPALLGNNMNHGQRINLRLRPPGDINTFYEYDQLVLVMLHELTHIEHGPHDAKFYKLLAELEEEYYDLKRKGYSGEGFHGKGNHLSGFKVPEHMGRAKGLEAAQKRLDTQRKMGKGGVLGGSDHRGRSMKDVLAEAAERRIRDDKACQSAHDGHSKEIEEEVRKAQEESVGIDASDLPHNPVDPTESEVDPKDDDEDEIQIIDPPLAERVPSDKSKPSTLAKQNRIRQQPFPSPTSTNRTSITAERPGAPQRPNNAQKNQSVRRPLSPGDNRAPKSSLPKQEWSCPICTLINPASSLSCEACTTPRPTVSRGMTSDGWYCGFCGIGPRDKEYWTCGECGWVRNFG